jgi:hypothetical protein
VALCPAPAVRPLHTPPRPRALPRLTPPPHCSSTGPRRDPSLTSDGHHGACPSRRLNQTPPPRPAACHHRVVGRPVPSHSATFTPRHESRPRTSPNESTAGYFSPPLPLPEVPRARSPAGLPPSRGYKRTRHAPTSPRTATTEPLSPIGSRAPPHGAPPPPVHCRPRTHLYTPSQPKVGRGIKYP